jgi:hypothetical protein
MMALMWNDFVYGSIFGYKMSIIDLFRVIWETFDGIEELERIFITIIAYVYKSVLLEFFSKVFHFEKRMWLK